MPALSKSGVPSLSTPLLPASNKASGLVAGEAIAAGDACRIHSDGKIYRSLGDTAEHAIVNGFAAVAASSGEAVTLIYNCRMGYAAGMTPGTPYYLSGSVAGGLDTAASTYGIRPIARAYDATRLELFRDEQSGLPSSLTSGGASLVEGRLAAPVTVDLNITTKQTLFTVPASKVAYVTKVVVRDPSIDLTTAAFGVGYDASGIDVIANATHTALTGPTLYEVIPAKAGAKEGAAAAVLGLKCGTAQGAAATAVVDVFGYLVDA